jgi:hypothetical protein
MKQAIELGGGFMDRGRQNERGVGMRYSGMEAYEAQQGRTVFVLWVRLSAGILS